MTKIDSPRRAPRAPRMRSALFAPGHRRDFLDKLWRSGADGVILDLEDSVPAALRPDARSAIASWIALPQSARQIICVRINALDQNCLEEDVGAAISHSLVALQIPKVRGPEDVLRVEKVLARLEAQAGLGAIQILIWPLLETALSVRNSFEIATCSPRIAYMGAGASPNGDLARDLGLHHTDSMLETLYVRSKVIVDVRAAGVPNPIGGLSTAIGKPAEVERYARFMRSLGYEGIMAIHPSQVVVANAVFGPTVDEIANARKLVAAFDAAQREGKGALAFDGGMIDMAHYRTALELLDRAGEFDRRRALLRSD